MNELLSEQILLSVRKPAQYIGRELNSIVKDWSRTDIKIALAFPDLYEIGMSHLGFKILYHILNEQQDILCERIFAPSVDYEKILREKNYSLFSLETNHKLLDFDIIGFSINYELCYTNILNILDMSKIPLFSNQRDENYPLIIAGGMCCFNPEPMSDFIDAFVIGEGEEIIFDIIEIYKKWKKKKDNKENLFLHLSQIEGIYVPLLYDVEYYPSGKIKRFKRKIKSIPLMIKKRIVSDLENSYFPTKPIVPYIETIHDRITLEISRGCPNSCRFCNSRTIYKPVRYRSIEKILSLAKESYKNTGYEEISLLSLSTADYPKIDELIEKLVNIFYNEKVAISVPSLRVDSFCNKNFAEKIMTIKKTGFTLAPEVASEKMRKIINKNISYNDLISAIKNISQFGWRNFKLYYIIGLPMEDKEDIISIAQQIKDILRDIKTLNIRQISITISSFIPKPHTPFQWEKQNTISEIEEKQKIILNNLPYSKKIKLSYHAPNKSLIEGILSRGDRKIGKVVYTAYKLGCKFDTWDDQFNFSLWQKAFYECKISPEFYIREREIDEILPWDFIDTGIDKNFLIPKF